MTRQQFISLRPGQMVRPKTVPGRFWMITKVYVPAAGGRVLELEGRLWISPSQVDEVLAA